jgi:glyoxylase I family protein
MARLKRIQHEGIPVSDLERSRAFYEGVLGLQPIPRPSFAVGGVWLSDPSGVPQIHLIVCDAETRGPDKAPTQIARHTAFLVEDYADLKRQFDERGIPYDEDTHSPAGVLQLVCVDPDGNVLEFQPAEHYGDGIYAPGFEPANA